MGEAGGRKGRGRSDVIIIKILKRGKKFYTFYIIKSEVQFLFIWRANIVC